MTKTWESSEEVLLAGGGDRSGWRGNFWRATRVALAGVWAVGLVGSSPAGQAPLTLKQCFELARMHSDKILSSEAAIRQAEAQLRQVWAAALPAASIGSTVLFQVEGAGGSGATTSPQAQINLGIASPTFTGYREAAALKGGEALVHQRKAERVSVDLLVFRDVASAYYAAVLAERNIATLEKTLGLTRDRLKEVESRERVGRSRKAEGLDLQAQVALFESQEESGRGTVRAARNLLEFLTGTSLNGELDTAVTAEDVGPVEAFLKDLDARPDLHAKRRAVEVASQAVEIARGAAWPGWNVSTHYYPARNGSSAAVVWDLGLGVTFPLWNAGVVDEAVSAAEASKRQVEAEERLTRRQVELEVRNAYEGAVSTWKALRLQERAVDLIRQSLESRVADYRLGLVTNFEVLDALSRHLQGALTLEGIRFAHVLSRLQLQAATGRLPEGWESGAASPEKKSP